MGTKVQQLPIVQRKLGPYTIDEQAEVTAGRSERSSMPTTTSTRVDHLESSELSTELFWRKFKATVLQTLRRRIFVDTTRQVARSAQRYASGLMVRCKKADERVISV